MIVLGKSNLILSFLHNSRDGGTLLIGIDDAGNVIGLSEDYCAANPQKANRDGYQLFLSDILKSNLSGGNWSLFHTISFGSMQGKDICRIDIQPADDAVYVRGGHFYVREGNRARLYSTQ